MAKWASSAALDGGPSYIKANATRMILLKAYTAGDAYTTVATTNNIGQVTITSTDFSGPSGATDRVLTGPASKSTTATAGSGASPNLHIAFTDGSANVIWVTDETSDQVVTSGNTINFPTVTYTSTQPV